MFGSSHHSVHAVVIAVVIVIVVVLVIVMVIVIVTAIVVVCISRACDTDTVLMLKMMETKMLSRVTDSNDAIKRINSVSAPPPAAEGTMQQVSETQVTQERLEGMHAKLERDVQAMDKRVMHQLQQLQAAQEAASKKNQISLDKIHALLAAGAQRTPLPGEIDA